MLPSGSTTVGQRGEDQSFAQALDFDDGASVGQAFKFGGVMGAHRARSRRSAVSSMWLMWRAASSNP